MAERRVTLVLYRDYGHPSNRHTKEYVLEKILPAVKEALEKVDDLKGWDVCSISVD